MCSYIICLQIAILWSKVQDILCLYNTILYQFSWSYPSFQLHDYTGKSSIYMQMLYFDLMQTRNIVWFHEEEKNAWPFVIADNLTVWSINLSTKKDIPTRNSYKLFRGWNSWNSLFLSEGFTNFLIYLFHFFHNTVDCNWSDYHDCNGGDRIFCVLYCWETNTRIFDIYFGNIDRHLTITKLNGC